MNPEVLAAIEALAWATYLDAYRSDKHAPHVFEEWRNLWKARKIEVPQGAWEVP